MTDKQILLLINTASTREKGYKAMMSNYQEMLYQHVRRITNDHDDTNDVLQNTFIKVFKNIENFRKDSSLYTWIYRIATNEALSILKKNKQKQKYFEPEYNHLGLENRAASQSAPETEKIQLRLKQAIEVLPDKQKSVFSLRYFEEMSYKNMSDLLGTSEGALKASYHHAVKKIEQFIKNTNHL
jgi:RNA polymerase sigma factor (sigma-70 family)